MLTKIEQDTMEAVQRLAAKAPALQELTLRDLFAMAAISKIKYKPQAYSKPETAIKIHADLAYSIADAMLVARCLK